MKNSKCIDAGREGCPCVLAEQGNCLICGRLSGGTCRDCSWQGTCIDTLYEQNGRKVVSGRQEQILPVVSVKTYSPDFKVFLIKAGKGFCQKAQTAGAYVFVRAENREKWFDMPISVLKAEPEKGLLHLGVCRCGAKSGNLLEAFSEKQPAHFEPGNETERFNPEGEGKPCREKTGSSHDSRKKWGNMIVRGVYYNGLSGLGKLSEDVERTQVFAKGIAAAPLRNFLDGGTRYTRLLKNLQLYMDIDKVGFDFFKEYFGDLPAASLEIRSFAEEAFCGDTDLYGLKDWEDVNIFALTSPYYADRIKKAAAGPVVYPTEGNFCCGEGICGACTCTDSGGNTVRRCKMKV